jgi:hypothetical protein
VLPVSLDVLETQLRKYSIEDEVERSEFEEEVARQLRLNIDGLGNIQ